MRGVQGLAVPGETARPPSRRRPSLNEARDQINQALDALGPAVITRHMRPPCTSSGSGRAEAPAGVLPDLWQQPQEPLLCGVITPCSGCAVRQPPMACTAAGSCSRISTRPAWSPG